MRLWVDIGVSYCVHHEEMQALFSLNSIGATVWILYIKDLMMKTVYIIVFGESVLVFPYPIYFVDKPLKECNASFYVLFASVINWTC